ncbi:MAG: four helix bundle protein [Oscillatoriaceae cyanobacterium Prado104]|jgi:four helix bundle protein|nr:four helix bundle protein [Oscillatoriaceae cyanobacterium Prado104]
MSKSIIQNKSFVFALEIIQLYRKLQEQREYVISKQLLRSGTSIGANVEEASAGQSRKDFLAKMSIASKEARETQYWLRLLQASQIVNVDVNEPLNHVDELIRILTSIVKTTGENL